MSGLVTLHCLSLSLLFFYKLDISPASWRREESRRFHRSGLDQIKSGASVPPHPSLLQFVASQNISAEEFNKPRGVASTALGRGIEGRWWCCRKTCESESLARRSLSLQGLAGRKRSASFDNKNSFYLRSRRAHSVRWWPFRPSRPSQGPSRSATLTMPRTRPP